MGNVEGIQDLNATWEAGFTKIWARIRDWERKQEYSFSRDLDPPFPDTCCIKKLQQAKGQESATEEDCLLFLNVFRFDP